MQIAFIGFIGHHFLPARWCLGFFAALSILVTVTAPGGLGIGALRSLVQGELPVYEIAYRMLPGLVLVSVGLVLIGVCHLRVRLGVRVGLLVLCGIGLAVIRANGAWFPEIAAIWPILGSMFVFRLMVYLYDLHHRTAPFSLPRSLAYFFMLPNVCFPLFPLVDYKTFCATCGSEPRLTGYQRGLQWMLRGIIHLLLHRLVYQFAPLDVSMLASSLDAVGFLLGTYLLYLRISGEFHLIVGLLHMFGFHLPETHHLYLLSASFTDFWRRINIYWKDFVMKLFFYPAFFAMRRWGTVRAMSLATVLTFVATWALHSWQWFWIRGALLLTWQDVTFWAVLAILVLINALMEATSSRGRRLPGSRPALREQINTGIKTVATFCAICLLWNIWSCRSMEELLVVADALAGATLFEVFVVIAGLVALALAGIRWGQTRRETSEGRPRAAAGTFPFWRVAASVSLTAIVLFALPRAGSSSGTRMARVLDSLQGHRLNARDLDHQRRGYYEELDVQVAGDARWGLPAAPDGWDDGEKRLHRKRSDILWREVLPSVSVTAAGETVSTNPFGMRDRDYLREKPPGSHRTVVLGASHTFGVGVRDDETFENQVEDRLNDAASGLPHDRYEMLNLSVGGYSQVQRLLRLEVDGFALQPDVALFVVFALDEQFALGHLARCLREDLSMPDAYAPFLRELFREAGVKGTMPQALIERRLRSQLPVVFTWVFQRLAGECARHGVRPLVVYRPGPNQAEHAEAPVRERMLGLARSAGLEVIDLSGCFAGVPADEPLVIAPWDEHTNAKGHRLLADALFAALRTALAGAGDASETAASNADAEISPQLTDQTL
ncbi:MAG: hypothetical protein H7A45_05325 [Verrucomicrobiales bacterium]|nr:hypothetical protein [Verrucomicrobiales bacterium]